LPQAFAIKTGKKKTTKETLQNRERKGGKKSQPYSPRKKGEGKKRTFLAICGKRKGLASRIVSKRRNRAAKSEFAREKGKKNKRPNPHLYSTEQEKKSCLDIPGKEEERGKGGPSLSLSGGGKKKKKKSKLAAIKKQKKAKRSQSRKGKKG